MSALLPVLIDSRLFDVAPEVFDEILRLRMAVDAQGGVPWRVAPGAVERAAADCAVAADIIDEAAVLYRGGHKVIACKLLGDVMKATGREMADGATHQPNTDPGHANR